MLESRLSVVIPAWNEAGRIGPSIERAVGVLRELAPHHEILIVDDGSSDDTVAVAREAARDADSFRALVNERNLGKGGAVRRGMLEAEGDWLLFCDADESTPMRTLERFLPHMLAGDPVLIGTRKNREARVARHQPWLRETMGKGFTLLARLLAGVAVTDFTCGYKIFRRDAARRIFPLQRLSDWSFDAEILHLAHRFGYPIREVPVVWSNDADTRVRLLRDTYYSARGLLRIARNRMSGVYAQGGGEDEHEA